MPPTASAAAAPASPAIVRSTRSESAGARKDQTCHSTIGSASRRRTLRRLPLRCPHRLDGGSSERRALELDVAARLVAAGHRALELAQPAAERAADLGQALRAEDEQHDEPEDDQLRQSDEAWHSNLLSLGGGAGAGEPPRR